jgi:hypothetical protein
MVHEFLNYKATDNPLPKGKLASFFATKKFSSYSNVTKKIMVHEFLSYKATDNPLEAYCRSYIMK